MDLPGTQRADDALAQEAAQGAGRAQGHASDDPTGPSPFSRPESEPGGGGLETDRRYRSTLIMMQYGRWPEVVDRLTVLKAAYPNEPILDSLLNEAQLKSELVVQWGTSIKGRRLTVRQERVLRRSIPFVMLITLAFLSLSFYQSFVAPSRQVVAMVKENQQIIEEAQVLTQNGQFEDALRQYEEVLARDPSSAGALQGIQETRDMMALVAEYDLAMQLAGEDNVDRALAFLSSIQAKSPGFRNVDVQIKELQSLEEAKRIFEAAEAAYVQGQWLRAVPLYEEVSETASNYQTATVEQRLIDAYYRAGLELTTLLPAPDAGPAEAQQYLRKGRSVDSQQADIHIKRLDLYFDGLEALDKGNLSEAINLWQGLYDTNPAYLGGYLAGRLYATYLSLAAQAEQQENYTYAQNLYEQALGLQVDDVSNAQSRLAALVATAAPTPAPTPQPVAVAYSPPPPPPPTPTPEPDFSGWIAFRTNRNGPEEIYIMRPDGMEQKPAPAGLAMRFEELLQQERVSWDGVRELRVMSPNGRTDANIYLVDLAIPEGQPRETMLTDFNGDEYDPVWSPQEDRIAFVANHTGNDEIWVVNADGTDAYQVTWNEWEWDKRPSFSPDGGQIVFYSNRSGWRQIWVMSSNGGMQYNLSYNAYDDWDPVWIK
jgi:tetratricopeptide (TPR) repeat protein